VKDSPKNYDSVKVLPSKSVTRSVFRKQDIKFHQSPVAAENEPEYERPVEAVIDINHNLGSMLDHDNHILMSMEDDSRNFEQHSPSYLEEGEEELN
jgi:hypothetical protein